MIVSKIHKIISDLHILLINHGSWVSRLVLEILYLIDLIFYSIGGAHDFLMARKEACNSSNFGALGRIIVGDYDLVQDLIETRSQKRGHNIGRLRMKSEAFNPHNPLFIGTGSEHSEIKEYLVEILNTYRDRWDMVTEIVDQYFDFGEQDMDRLIIRATHKAFLNLDLTSEEVDKIYYVTFDATGSFLVRSIDIFPSVFASKKGIRYQTDIKDLYRTSDVYQDSEQFSRQDFVDVMFEILCVAGNLGTSTLLKNALKVDLPETIDENIVLELSRYRAPVNNINMSLDSEYQCPMGGKSISIPSGVTFCANLALANHDSTKYSDPEVIRTDRDYSDFLGFNGKQNPRSCPGRQFVLDFGVLVLNRMNS